MPAMLHMTRGLPGSGKTYLARQMVDGATPRGSLVRVNRDDLRRMMLPSDYRAPERDLEHLVTAVQHATISSLLRAGRDVICDDTNLAARHVQALMEVAAKAEADQSILDMTHVSLDICIARDALRGGTGHVGEVVIRRMHAQYVAQHRGKPLPVPELPDTVSTDPYSVVVPYTPPVGARLAVLVDVDGTTALLNGRNPYDESRVIDDLPNVPVIETVQALIRSGFEPVFMSGRTSGCRAATYDWLRRNVIPGIRPESGAMPELHMRSVGDQRPDWQVKLELFNTHVRDRFNVRLAIDDRDQVVKLWRRLGITCLQCAEGDF